MSEGDPRSSGGEPGADRLRMDLYELLHDRAEKERRWQLFRLAAGHVVVGVILAYAFIFDAGRFISLTPVLYGIVVMDGLRSSVRMLYLQQQLAELESRLAEREPLFNWVTQYGFFGTGRGVDVWDVDLNTVPETAQYVLILSIYAALILASLVAWTPPSAGADGFAVTRELLVLSYATFTVLFAVIVAVAYIHYRRVRDRIAQLAAARPVE